MGRARTFAALGFQSCAAGLVRQVKTYIHALTPCLHAVPAHLPSLESDTT